jgi:N-acetylglucosaminyldiphosphoundecaprenol N-acetyl-beta-D-mannosaminyltransferase
MHPSPAAFRKVDVIGTPCALTSHAELIAFLNEFVAARDEVLTVDFTNVHIVTLRRVDAAFREMTDSNDLFVPDSQVLTWAVRLRGGRGHERVYGPDFMRRCLSEIAADTRHYFLGGSPDTLEKLIAAMKRLRPEVKVAGSHHGYFDAGTEAAVVEDIRRASPDLIWVGLGTPKQQAWIARNARQFSRGALLAVGFAFDVNAGTKKDSPPWMGRLGLTWLYRLCSEPRRLLQRYAYFNTLFLWYLAGQVMRRKSARPPQVSP